MLTVLRVLLDGSARPRQPAPARRANCILGKDLRQSVRELIAKCRNVFAGAHGSPQTWEDLRNITQKRVRARKLFTLSAATDRTIHGGSQTNRTRPIPAELRGTPEAV
jgi:hypothetical protein